MVIIFHTTQLIANHFDYNPPVYASVFVEDDTVQKRYESIE